MITSTFMCENTLPQSQPALIAAAAFKWEKAREPAHKPGEQITKDRMSRESVNLARLLKLHTTAAAAETLDRSADCRSRFEQRSAEVWGGSRSCRGGLEPCRDWLDGKTKVEGEKKEARRTHILYAFTRVHVRMKLWDWALGFTYEVLWIRIS